MIQRKKKECRGCNELKFLVSRGLCSYCKNKQTMDEQSKKPIKHRIRSAPIKRKRKPKSSNKKKKQGLKSKTLTYYKKRLWSIFSKFIRLRDSDENGYITCITCDRPLFWKQSQAGHFIPQHNNPNTIFNEQNVHAQCPQCNIYLHGNQYLYSKKIDSIYGIGTSEEIYLLSKVDKKFTSEEYQELTKEYNEKVNKILQEKGLIF